MKSKIITILILISVICAQDPSSNPNPDPNSGNIVPEKPDVIESEEEQSNSEFQNLIEDFNTHLGDINPDDVITFEMKPNSDEIFFEEVTDATVLKPGVFRGLFFAINTDEKDFLFQIINPKNIVIKEIRNRAQGAFAFNITEKGVYKFRFRNEKLISEMQVTFVFHYFHEHKEIVEAKHVNATEAELVDSLKLLREVEILEKVAERRQEVYLSNIHSRKQRILVFTVVETSAIILTTLIQMYFIKKLLENKVFV